MTITQLAPPDGMWTDAGLIGLPKGKAHVIENFLIDRPGMLRTRGKFGDSIYDLTGWSPIGGGIWVYGETFLASGTPNSKLFDTNGFVSDVATATSATTLRGRSVRLGAWAYGPSANTVTTLLRWGGSGAPSALTGAPVNSADVAAHLGRLFVAGGTKPGTTTPLKPNSLWWTDVGGPVANALTDWQDDVSGLVNQIDVGDDGDAIVALASLGRQLLIFKNYSIWAAIGDSPSTFSLRRIASTMGALSKMAVLVADDQCIFFNNSVQPTLYDGTSFERLSGLDSLFGNPLSAGSAQNSQIVRLPRDYFLVYNPGLSSDPGDRVLALLYLPNRTWSRVTCPTTVVNGVYGTDSVWLAATEQGSAVLVSLNKARLLEDLVDPGASGQSLGKESLASSSSTFTNIVPTVTYARQNLALPLSRAVVKRVALDYSLEKPTASWSLSLSSVDGSVASTLSFAGNATSPQRGVQAVHGPTSDLVATLTFSDAAVGLGTGVPSPEVYDLYVEHESAQRR